MLNFHNRKYKDRLFQRVFQDKRNLLDLYNAINGTNHQDPEELEITTLHMLLTEFDEKKMRAIPASRSVMQNIVKSTGCINSGMYLAKNLALSMTDTYWVCPENATLKYDQVKFANLSMYSNGKVPYHNATSYDYNASLGGQMEKY